MLTLADYNPSVLYLVTLPNFILVWALQHAGDHSLKDAFSEGELELSQEVVQAFKNFLLLNHVTLSFLSGAWSSEFVDLLYTAGPAPATESNVNSRTLVLGAETIYSPFALDSFSQTLLSILQRERSERPGGQAAAIIAAKRLYFGVGGSLDDFIEKMQAFGAAVENLREESDGVRRGVVRCLLPDA
jgi:protein-histidine N-methyltransferase